MTGGQVHDSQVVEEILNTPRVPLAVTADKAYDSEKVRQQIRDEGALPVIPNRASPPATTSSRATSWPLLRSSPCTTGSNCEPRP